MINLEYLVAAVT